MSLFSCRFTSEPLSTPAIPEDNVQSDALIQEMRSQDFAYGAPPTAVGLDDNFRPSMDSSASAEQSLPSTSQISTSYDDLRRQNRDDFQQKRQEYKPSVGDPKPSAPYVKSNSLPSSQGVKNSYGDVWEE